MEKEGFQTFHEIITIGTKKILETFDDEKIYHFNFLMDITPTCDCMGIIQPQIVPDIGIVASRDIVALEQASIDLVATEELIINKIPAYFKHLNIDPLVDLHPFQRLLGPLKDPYDVTKFGEKYGLRNCSYELIEILSAEETVNMKGSHSYERGPSFG